MSDQPIAGKAVKADPEPAMQPEPSLVEAVDDLLQTIAEQLGATDREKGVSFADQLAEECSVVAQLMRDNS